jgi:hypothetical protein
MKKLMTISFVLALLVYAVAVAQYGAQSPDNSKSSVSMKAVSITGTISDDGKMFVSDKDSKSWTISPGRCGQERGSCRVAQDGEGYYAKVNHPSLLSQGQRSCWPFLFAEQDFRGS